MKFLKIIILMFRVHHVHVSQQTNNLIVANRLRQNKGPYPRLIHECSIIHYALISRFWISFCDFYCP
jgi:hypothetical protein